MGIGRALVNKLKRRRKSANQNRGFRQQDKIDLRDEKLADSPKVFTYLRGIQRRLDSNFGQQMQPNHDKQEKEMLILGDIDRTIDPKLEITLAAGLLAAVGVQPGDVVTVLTGVLKGRQFTVTDIDSSTVFRMEDDADLAAPEVGAAFKVMISGTKKSFR